MAQQKYTDGSGVAEIWANIKNYIASQLLGYSQTGHTHSASDITSGLSTVATSGSYADLSNKPSIPVIDSALSSTSTNGLQNKVIKTALDGKANSTHTHSASDITSGLATVATSGSYNDLSNKPTIPTVNNATLTIQKNGTNVQTFTANQSTNATANITVPTKTSDLTNDSGFLTSDSGLLTSVLPIGSYIQFAGSQAPEGFLVCNGGAISRTTYSKLFAVIGTTYGSGDGSTTFNLPNLTDRFLQGSTTSGNVINAGLPNITGKFNASTNNTIPIYFNPNTITTEGAFSTDKAVSGRYSFQNASKGAFSNMKFDASDSNPIYGASNTVQPPALTCLICIKY